MTKTCFTDFGTQITKFLSMFMTSTHLDNAYEPIRALNLPLDMGGIGIGLAQYIMNDEAKNIIYAVHDTVTQTKYH